MEVINMFYVYIRTHSNKHTGEHGTELPSRLAVNISAKQKIKPFYGIICMARTHVTLLQCNQIHLSAPMLRDFLLCCCQLWIFFLLSHQTKRDKLLFFQFEHINFILHCIRTSHFMVLFRVESTSKSFPSSTYECEQKKKSNGSVVHTRIRV